MISNEPKIDGPIPGQSLTAEPKSRPWRRPYQFASVDEAVEFYMPQFADETFVTLLTEQIENGIPLTTISEILTTANVMEGRHSIDVAVLVSPVLIEAMQFVADNAGIEPVIGTESELYNTIGKDSELVRRAVSKLPKGDSEDLESIEMDAPMEEESMMAEEPEPQMERRGLMAPRGTE